ncbi:MAG: saccharopine dehydrogenase family protein [Dokdonella sp.]|uniref:saccharopine dehydrogenase family protein n=1 Tax=Dokdonella sp. TaxID=2291710 RepID=UPI003F8026A9
MRRPAARPFRIVVLGGYGLFGTRIVRGLAGDEGLELVVAGRDAGRARRFADELARAGARAAIASTALDVEARDFAERLAALAPALVVHTAGPFQGRDYGVARLTLALGAHYLDLADGRTFVAGFGALDAEARAAGRRAVSGASSVPGLSGAVVAAFAGEFGRLDAIETAISPGNRTPRGLATTRAILGYVGRPYPVLDRGRWQRAHGWQSLRRLRVPDVGTRWLARCEVPDLSLLPERHPTLRSCDFRAGLELRRMHFGLWLASWAVRGGVVHDFARQAPKLLALSERWLAVGSDIGLMQIDLRGVDREGVPRHLRWRLVAAHGDGPQVPATAANIHARKLARGELPGGGAGACLDLFTLDECLAALDGYAITTIIEKV